MIIDSDVTDVTTLTRRIQDYITRSGNIMSDVSNDPEWYRNIFLCEPFDCQPNILWRLKNGALIKLANFSRSNAVIVEIEEVFTIDGVELCNVTVHTSHVVLSHAFDFGRQPKTWRPVQKVQAVMPFAYASYDGQPKYHLGRLDDVVAHGVEPAPPHVTELPVLLDTRLLTIDPTIKIYIDPTTGMIKHSGERVFLYPRNQDTGKTVGVGGNRNLPVLSLSPEAAINLLPTMILPHNPGDTWQPSHDDTPPNNVLYENYGVYVDVDTGADFYGNGMMIGWDSRKQKFTLSDFSERFDGNPYDNGSLKGVVPFTREQQADIMKWMSGTMFPDEELNLFTKMPAKLTMEEARDLVASKTAFDDVFVSHHHVEDACKYMSQLGGGAVSADLVQRHFSDLLYTYDDDRMYRLRPNDENAVTILKTLFG